MRRRWARTAVVAAAFVLLAGTNRQAPRADFRTRTLLPTGTLTTVLRTEGNPDAGIVVGISSGNPLARDLALRTL